MEKQREMIQKMEEQQNDTEHRLDSCSKEEEEHLLEQHQQQTDSIEHQQKIFDDMEFKQLEVHIFAFRAAVFTKNIQIGYPVLAFFVKWILKHFN